MKNTASSMAAERRASSSQIKRPPTMTSRLSTAPRPGPYRAGYPQRYGVQEVLLQAGFHLALDKLGYGIGHRQAPLGDPDNGITAQQGRREAYPPGPGQTAHVLAQHGADGGSKKQRGHHQFLDGEKKVRDRCEPVARAETDGRGGGHDGPYHVADQRLGGIGLEIFQAREEQRAKAAGADRDGEREKAHQCRFTPWVKKKPIICDEAPINKAATPETMTPRRPL